MTTFQPPATPPSHPQYVPDLIQQVLVSAQQQRASDVHFVPTEAALEMLWRIDGVLQPVGEFPAELTPRVVARLKVLAELLTYHTEVPQEGRIRGPSTTTEMRVSTFPTLFGEKVVVRLFVGSGTFQRVEDLGFPADVQAGVEGALGETSGLLLVAGPAGSGKTTTIYACLREILNKSPLRRSLVSLEDPVEATVPGVAQSQINPGAGFGMAEGLRSLMRQDPEVILVGEIRDREVADVVCQASLTGHLVLTTFHAGSAAGAIARLLDMGLEPYLLRSGLLAIVSQRLVRKLCACAVAGAATEDRLGLPVATCRVPRGCPACQQAGYRGRLVLAELLRPETGELGRAILERRELAELERVARQGGMIDRWQRGVDAVERGDTSPAELRRVLGFHHDPGALGTGW